jgi:hypothetical protein
LLPASLFACRPAAALQVRPGFMSSDEFRCLAAAIARGQVQGAGEEARWLMAQQLGVLQQLTEVRCI